MDFKGLLAYQKAFSLSMDIFQLSKRFPKEETYSLTDQVRRSSRSVCANIAEAYRKRIYIKNFISKMTDSDAENRETAVWLDFALSCDYLEPQEHAVLYEQTVEIGKLVNYMIQHPEKFGCKEY
ncbi:four helix bundle protein [Mangrovibacterium lignilyticum]|uniref:four helix bundle protein n=1 Tax=Mangrovibacterium lignilyticum TaxID=2668052 RepID=UPI0013D0EA60|nr:four helix bundle protein [Mangrovibacterium lignilyticum]